MEGAIASLATRARSIFDDLGYTVVGEGADFRAERDWKVVRVTATDGTADADRRERGDGLRCYVTTSEHVRSLRDELDGSGTDEWAIIAIDGDDHEVVRAPPGPAVPA